MKRLNRQSESGPTVESAKALVEPPVIVCQPDSIRVSSDAEVVMRKESVKVTTARRVFEVDLATDSVASYRIPKESQPKAA